MILACGGERGNLPKMLSEASVVVCSNLIEEKIKGIAPQGKEIIIDNRR